MLIKYVFPKLPIGLTSSRGPVCLFFRLLEASFSSLPSFRPTTHHYYKRSDPHRMIGPLQQPSSSRVCVRTLRTHTRSYLHRERGKRETSPCTRRRRRRERSTCFPAVPGARGGLLLLLLLPTPTLFHFISSGHGFRAGGLFSRLLHPVAVVAPRMRSRLPTLDKRACRKIFNARRPLPKRSGENFSAFASGSYRDKAIGPS